MSFTPGAGTRFLVSTGASGTPLSGPLSITGGTATANTPVLSATQTWNNAAVTFTGWQLNVTDTASNAASLLMDLQVGGSSRFAVSKAGGGTVYINSNNYVEIGSGYIRTRFGASNGFDLSYLGLSLGEQSPLLFKQVPNGVTYSALFCTSAGIIEQRNGVDAQTKRLYGTFTDASNYRRLAMAMTTGGVASIAPEGAGTGASGNVLHISGLPTANPGPGILWNDAGTVKVGT